MQLLELELVIFLLLGHENPFHRGPHGFIRNMLNWILKPHGFPVLSIPMLKTSILMSP